MKWDYVVRDLTKENDGEPLFVISEAYYNEAGDLCGTSPVTLCAESKENLVTMLQRILADIN